MVAAVESVAKFVGREPRFCCTPRYGLQDPHALALLAVILIEAAMLSEADVRVAAWWENVISVQFSYLAGFFARRTLEQTGYSLPPVKIPRPR